MKNRIINKSINYKILKPLRKPTWNLNGNKHILYGFVHRWLQTYIFSFFLVTYNGTYCIAVLPETKTLIHLNNIPYLDQNKTLSEESLKRDK